MAKKVKRILRLQLLAGKATPAPPVGTALGPHGLNIMEFCKNYNEQSKGMTGVVPVEITVFDDRSFSFVLREPPVSVLLLAAAGIEKGSSQARLETVGSINEAQLAQIAKRKMPELNATSLMGAMNTIRGTARTMGIQVTPN